MKQSAFDLIELALFASVVVQNAGGSWTKSKLSSGKKRPGVCVPQYLFVWGVDFLFFRRGLGDLGAELRGKAEKWREKEGRGRFGADYRICWNCWNSAMIRRAAA